jgi:hypothetical protein
MKDLVSGNLRYHRILNACKQRVPAFPINAGNFGRINRDRQSVTSRYIGFFPESESMVKGVYQSILPVIFVKHVYSEDLHLKRITKPFPLLAILDLYKIPTATMCITTVALKLHSSDSQTPNMHGQLLHSYCTQPDRGGHMGISNTIMQGARDASSHRHSNGQYEY